MRQIREGFLYINHPLVDDKVHIFVAGILNRLCDNEEINRNNLFGIITDGPICEKCMYIVATEPYSSDANRGER